MLAQFVRPHRSRIPLLAALVLASAMSTLLIVARVLHTGRLTYVFLVYNLVLAWIPLGLAVAADSLDQWPSRLRGGLTTLSLLAWLAFFPNAPYLMTDFKHLRLEGNPLFWLDLTTMQAFAWTGLALGFASLTVAQKVVARRIGGVWSWFFAAAVLVACAVGIYLGRFHRWNSWDLIRDPMGILTDVAFTLRHPLANAHAIAYCGVLVSFLLTAYLVVQAWTFADERSADPGVSA
jgi:uncharacterized membrane protein